MTNTHIPPLDRPAPLAIESVFGTDAAAGAAIDPPKGHSVKSVINASAMHKAIELYESEVAPLKKQADEKRAAFAKAFHRGGVEGLTNARDHALAVGNSYDTMLDKVDGLINDSIKKVKGGVIPKYQALFSKYAGMAREFREQRHLWYGYQRMIQAALTKDEFKKAKEMEIVDIVGVAKTGMMARQSLEEARELLKLLPQNKEVDSIQTHEIYKKYDLTTAAALQCYVNITLCEMDLDYILMLEQTKDFFCTEGKRLAALDLSALSDEEKNKTVKLMHDQVYGYAAFVDLLHKYLDEAKESLKEYGEPVPQPKINPTKFKEEWAALMAYGEKYHAAYEPIRAMEPVDRIDLQGCVLEELRNSCSGSAPELQSCLDKIKSNLNTLESRYIAYNMATQWNICKLKGLESKFSQELMRKHGWDENKHPADADCTLNKRYAILHPLPALYEQGAEHALRIGAALEVEFEPHGTTAEKTKMIADAVKATKELAPALRGMASFVRTILDKLVQEGASTEAVNAESEFALAKSIDWNIDGIYEATSVDEDDEAPDIELASSLATVALDEPAASGPAPGTDTAAAAQPGRSLTESQKQKALDGVDKLVRQAGDYREHASRINNELNGRIEEWFDGRRKALEIRDGRNNPPAVESNMHLAAEKLQRAANKLEWLAKKMKDLPDAAERQAEITGYSERAKGLREDAEMLREDGTQRCLELIAEMPIEHDIDYLVESRHIERVDRPTWAPIYKRDRATNDVIWGDDAEPLKDYVHEYKIHLKYDISLVAHLRYETEDADPSTTPSFWNHLKRTDQARLGYQSQRRAKEENQFYERIWRGHFDSGKVLPKLQSYLDEGERMPLPEYEDQYR